MIQISANMTKEELRKQISAYFNISELKDLCFDLEIEFENIPGDTLDDKSREIIKHCQRNGQTLSLINKCRKMKPFLNWSESEQSIYPPDSKHPNKTYDRNITISIEQGNILSYDADVVAFKYADYLFGADRAVAFSLNKTDQEIHSLIPNNGDFQTIPSLGRVKAKYVFFKNVGNLFAFDYMKIRSFAAQTLENLASHTESSIRNIAMTIHGVGYGLDEAESLKAQLAGFLDALENRSFPHELEKIIIVERNHDRVTRLNQILSDAIIENPIPVPKMHSILSTSERSIIPRSVSTRSVGEESYKKPYVVVTMCESDESGKLDDIYYYGIKEPINRLGYICEKITLNTNLNDEFEQGKKRIETASLVIAELSEINAEVYLTLGYALGKNRPTILIMSGEEKIPNFEIKDTKCLTYQRIRDLEKNLHKEICSILPSTLV